MRSAYFFKINTLYKCKQDKKTDVFIALALRRLLKFIRYLCNVFFLNFTFMMHDVKHTRR